MGHINLLSLQHFDYIVLQNVNPQHLSNIQQLNSEFFLNIVSYFIIFILINDF